MHKNQLSRIDTSLPYQRLPLDRQTLDRTILSLAAPAVGENLMFTMVFLTDTLLVGWLRDENALAASAFCGLVMMLVNAPFYAISVTANSIVSRCWGEHDFDSGRKYAGHTMTMSFLATLLIFFICLPMTKPIIALLGGSPTVSEMAGRYFRILLLSAILGLPLIVSNSIIRAKGDAKTPMLITIVMNLINVIASITLAFGLLGIPRLGFIGVAWGTVMARTIGGLISIFLLADTHRGVMLRPVHLFNVDFNAYARIWRQTYPTLFERSLQSLSSLVFIKIVALLGTTALAAHHIALHVESVAFMPALGAGAAAATITGQAIGAGLNDIAELTVKKTLLWTCGLMLGIGIVFIAAAPFAVKAFGATKDVVHLAGVALQISSLELPFLAATIILSSSLRGAGDTRSTLYVSIVCLVLFRLCGVYLLAIYLGWGLPGVWLATAIDWAARSLGLWWFFNRGVWKLIHHKEKLRLQTFHNPPP